MMKYPLYEELVKQVNEKENQNFEVSHICPTINGISLNNVDTAEHYEEMYAIIIHYELLTNSNILLTLTPNQGTLLPGGKGIVNILNKLPLPLTRILYQYIEYYSS